MATLGELLDLAERYIRDSYYTRTILTKYVNRALREVAGTVPVPLPRLETTYNVTTSTSASYVALPTATGYEYQRDFDYCYSTATDGNVKIYSSLEMLTVEDPSLSLGGHIIGVAISGANLWYVMRPGTADTLRLHYFRKPRTLSDENLTDETGTPLSLPDHLHESLLVSKVCEYAFTEIEDGVDGAKVNTEKYRQDYMLAFAQLVQWIGPKKSRPVLVSDIMTPEFE